MKKSFLAKGGAIVSALALTAAMVPSLALAADGDLTMETGSDGNFTQIYGKQYDSSKSTATVDSASTTAETLVKTTNGDESDPTDGIIGADYKIAIPATVSLHADADTTPGELGTYENTMSITYDGTIGAGEKLTITQSTASPVMKDKLGWSSKTMPLTVTELATRPVDGTSIKKLSGGINAETDGTISGTGFYKLSSDITDIGQWQSHLTWTVKIAPTS